MVSSCEKLANVEKNVVAVRPRVKQYANQKILDFGIKNIHIILPKTQHNALLLPSYYYSST